MRDGGDQHLVRHRRCSGGQIGRRGANFEHGAQERDRGGAPRIWLLTASPAITCGIQTIVWATLGFRGNRQC
jgi:hypothetical protein